MYYFYRRKRKKKRYVYKKVNHSNIYATKIVILIPGETKYSRPFQTKFFHWRIVFSK